MSFRRIGARTSRRSCTLARAILGNPRSIMTESNVTSPMNPHLRDAQLASLAELLGQPFTEAGVREWLQSAAARELAFKDFYWGHIRWPRSIGRSAGGS